MTDENITRRELPHSQIMITSVAKQYRHKSNALTFLVLDLGLDIVGAIGRLDLEGDGLAREGLVREVDLVTKICMATSPQTRSYDEQTSSSHVHRLIPARQDLFHAAWS